MMDDSELSRPETYQPTWRKPAGIIALLFMLGGYCLIIAGLAAPIGNLPVLVQTLVYIILGTVWLLPLKRFLIWMETGRWG